jgi:hypothetical protein
MVAVGNTDAAVLLKLPSLRSVLGFGARFACVLALLLAPWPGLGKAYGAAATKFGNAVLAPFESSRVQMIFVEPDSSAPTSVGFTTVLVAQDLNSGKPLQIPIELRTLAFIPTAAFIALVLADHRRRGVRRTALQLFSGLTILQLFLCVSLVVPIVLFFAEPLPMHLWTLSAPVYWTMTVFYRSLVAPPGMIYAVPLLLWLTLRTVFRPAQTSQD